jgi:hypothetical protein
MTPIGLAFEMRALAAAIKDTPVPDTATERDLLAAASEVVVYELDGLAERIRAADKVNGTKRPTPVKPLKPRPADPQPQPDPQPKQDPPPDGGGR